MDRKLFICRETNLKFAEEMEAAFNAGCIAPFSVVFRQAENRALINDADKLSKDVIQFSFLVSDCDGNVLLTYRTQFSNEKEAGHTVTVGDSVLIGWSPVIPLPGHQPYPMSDTDILWAYHKEVQDAHLRKPQVHFLGLVLNEVKGIRYYLYVFHVQYGEREPDLRGLLKDRHDKLCAYHSADDALCERVRDKKADLRALELYTRRDLSTFGFGSSRVVRFDPRTKPPFRVHAPDVFISHAKQNDAVATRIAEALAAAGLSCWADHRSLKPGDLWFREIEAGIKYGGCFMVLCSRHSLESKAVDEEVSLALARQDDKRDPAFPIIPVILEGDSMKQFLPVSLRDKESGRHAEDFRNLTNAEEPTRMNVLVQRVRERLAWLNQRQF